MISSVCQKVPWCLHNSHDKLPACCSLARCECQFLVDRVHVIIFSVLMPLHICRWMRRNLHGSVLSVINLLNTAHWLLTGKCYHAVFSWSYCHAVWSAIVIIMSVRKCVVAKRYTLVKVSKQVNRKCPPTKWFHIIYSYIDPISSNSPPPKFRNFTYLLYISRFLDHVTILFMLLRTWATILVEVNINASYTVWLAIWATAGLLDICSTTLQLITAHIIILLEFLDF